MNPLIDLSNSTFDLQWWADGVLLATLKSPESGDGFAYICEACEHQPWAVKYFPNRAVLKFYGACKVHPSSRGEIPGSLVLWWHDELERMPAVLVEREYALHLAYYDKEKYNVQAQSGDTRSQAIPRSCTEGLLAELERGTGEVNRPGA